jgi:hypothetical protein
MGLLHKVTLAARMALPGHPVSEDELEYVLAWVPDPERFLDFIHFFLQVAEVGDDDVRALDRVLQQGSSVWRATTNGLERRVSPAIRDAFEMAASPGDTASDELVEAWTKAYGRNPDPSDAWDHSIKAVEAILRPIVCPNHSKATLSNVIGVLRSQGNLWQLGLRGRARDHSVAPLVQMLELIWTDPNRHGSATPELPATLEEARSVVHLAVTIVQWGRDGLIARR